MSKGFCHLHCHSEYSSLDGGSRVTNMPAKLEELGMSAMALTDHGVMQGLPDFQKELVAAGIKPILGLEAYLTEDRFDRSRGTTTWHITLLAETTEGYHNLCKISSRAFIDGTIKTFGRPRARADWALLEEFSEGIICLTGCMAGPVMRAIMQDGSITEARAYTERLVGIFGKDSVYGELQNVGITVGVPGDSEVARWLSKEPLTEAEAAGMEGYHGDVVEEVVAGEVPISQTEANRILVEEVCKPLGLDYVATGDVHYLNEDDALPHDAMLCIGTGQIQRGDRRFSLLPKKYHMRSEQEMREAIPEYPEAIERTVDVAERCTAEIEYGKELLPSFPIPEGFKGSSDYLRHLCQEGLEHLYPEGNEHRAEAPERLEYELGVIEKMGYNDYFLIVWDLFREAAERGIPAGPGRGSAAGSIVAYTLGITQLCPLEYGLLFERFLNPDRVSMPDIDMDFGPSRRGELIQYSVDKYNALAGVDTAVAQQVTFSRYKAKGALRDSSRVLAEPSEDGRREAMRVGDRLAGLIPNDPSATMRSVWEDKREGDQLRRAFKQGPLQKAIIKQAGWLEGLVRAYSIHAAAVLIGDHDLSDDLPLQQFGEGQPLHVQYEMNWAEALGLLKMDFLGLRNLEVIQETLEKLRYTRGVELDPYRIPIDDPTTYELFASGQTVGTFQFESDGMQAALREVGPTEFRDLIALVALYRPGPMAYIPTYAARKHGREETTYLHPKLESILGETYGVTVFQEQSMLIAREIAGFTPGQADDLRKAIGKKLRDKMDALKAPYLKGCEENGIPRETAEALWADNEAAADYSFNKSHAACYAYVSYVTGYLKANYPEEYMASLLSSVMGDKDKAPLYLTEAKRMGLRVLPPDLNRSLKDFAVMERQDEPEEFDILFGLTAIKKVGGAIVQEILQERQRSGPYDGLRDLLRRIPNLSRAVCEALVLGGALDFTGASRQAMFEMIEEIKEEIKLERAAEEKEWKNGVKAEAEAAEGKLSTPEKRGLEAAALLALDRGELPGDEELREAIAEKLEREDLRIARAEARKRAKEEGLDPKSDESKTRIETEGQAAAAGRKSERDGETERLLGVAKAAIEKYLEAGSELEGLEAAMQMESDATPITGPEWPEIDKLNRERGVLGVYVSGHPLDQHLEKWAHTAGEGLGRIGEQHIGQTLYVIAVVVNRVEQKTRTGKKMFRITFEDPTGSRESIAWQEAVEGYEPLLEIGKIVAADVVIEEDHFQNAKREEGEDDDESGAERATRMTISKLYSWNPEKIPDTWTIRLPIESYNEVFRQGLRELAQTHPGSELVKLAIKQGEEERGKKTELKMSRTNESERAVRELIEQAFVTEQVIEISEDDLSPEFIASLGHLAEKHPGDRQLVVMVRTPEGRKRKRTRYLVSSDIEAELVALTAP
jgi:DNA polymerase-3 subunit alpha